MLGARSTTVVRCSRVLAAFLKETLETRVMPEQFPTHLLRTAAWQESRTSPKGPCTQIVYTLALKVFPKKVHWAQSIYYLGT